MGKKRADKRPFWAGDCETDPFKYARVPKPFIWGIWTGAGYHEFNTAAEMVEFIRDCDVIIYFHNGGKFDLHFLLEWINLEEKVTVINGRLVVAHIGKCELRDSWNLLPVPLAAINKDDFDYTLLEESERNKPGVMAKIRRYLMSDCINLYNAVADFEGEYGRHLTLAGAAMAQWEKLSGKAKPSTDREFFQKFSAWYCGGRVQCFQKGKIDGPIQYKDINSAYPWAMLTEHPYDPEYITTKRPTEYKATSFLTVECISNGCLPYKDERGVITYPDDNETRTFHVVGHELKVGEETGTVRNVRLLESIDFLGQSDFKTYILHFWGRRVEFRAQGNDSQVLFAKLLMTNLYGKFGANPDNYGNFICVPLAEMEAYMTDGYEFDGMIGPHALLRAPLDDWQTKFINVATAASITSQVRSKLWRAIVASEDPVYCDTDSLMARVVHIDEGKEIGEWGDEGTASTVYIAGKKMYLCEGIFSKDGKPKMATKGVRLTPDQIRRAAMGQTVTAQSEAPTFRLRGAPVFQSRNIKATA